MKKLDFIYKNENFFVLNKPACIHSVIVKNKENESIAKILLENFPELKDVSKKEEDAGLVNRLDFETSGLLFGAFKKKYWELLFNFGKNGKIKKEYYALVEGQLSDDKIFLSNYIGNPNRGGKKVKVYERQALAPKRSQIAESTFFEVKYFKELDCSLVKVKLVQGRRHQIRAHLSYLNCPLVGDELYQSRRKLSEILPTPKNLNFFLHAKKIELSFSETDSIQVFETTFPKYIEMLINS